MPRIKRIHVNQHNIKANKKNQENKPVLSCKTSASNDYGHEVAILDKDGAEVARVIYSPNRPLSCGARCWIVTRNPVDVIENDPEGNETGRISVD
jgi:hypothetical protein|tara:strand:- start:194 stop:478 length:285 start_codon:yes stop_codon:yes gene_type:complete